MLDKNVNNRYKNWEEVKSTLKISSNNETNNEFINEMVSKRINYNITKEKERIEKQNELQRINEEIQLISYSFKSSIIDEINKFITSFNSSGLDGQVKIQESNRDGDNYVRYIIISMDNEITTIGIEIIKNRTFSYRAKDAFNYEYDKKYRPQLLKKNIIAWGGICSKNGTGINLFLVEDDSNIYGKWYYAITTNSGLSRTERPEPICFQYDELEREVDCFNAMHIYNTSVKPLNSINEIIDFITFCKTS
jgi:hypothetical protein